MSKARGKRGSNVGRLLGLGLILMLILNACAVLDLIIPPTGEFELMWSESPTGEDPRELDGSVLIGDVYVFVTHNDQVERVLYYLDDGMLDSADRPPFSALLPAQTLSGESHVLVSYIHLKSDEEAPREVRASFTVRDEAPPEEPEPPEEPGELPSPWQHDDIGEVGVAGTASSSSAGSFTIRGSGADIWGREDAFHYVYRELSGDGEFVFKLTQLDAADEGAKAGLMLRESLDPGARNALVAMTKDGRVTFQRRLDPGGETIATPLEGRSPPQWLKLVRQGSLVDAYASADGENWELVGSDSLGMSDPVYLGLAVTSREPGTLATASFEPASPGTAPTCRPATSSPASGLSGIGFLGDSNTELFYLVPTSELDPSYSVTPELSEDMRYSVLVGADLGVDTTNYGIGGTTTAQFLSGSVLQDWQAGDHAYYLITFGLNDAKVRTPDEFRSDTRALIEEVQSIGAIPVLVTNVSVDYPDHYDDNRNPTIELYDDQYRALAAELDLHLIDVNQTFEAMNAAGDWDTRKRNTGDSQRIVLDDSQDAGKDVEWYTDIHYNVRGSETVAREIVDYFECHSLTP